MSIHDSGLGEFAYAEDVIMVDAPSDDAPSMNVQDSSAQDPEMEGVVVPQAVNYWERYAALSAAYHEYFAQFLHEDAKEELKKESPGDLLAMQTEAMTLNVPIPQALPPKKYFHKIPKDQTFRALVEMPVRGTLFGNYTTAELRTTDVRVRFDAGAQATPGIDIVVNISSDGQAIDMRDPRKFTQLRLRCNAGYCGHVQGGIALASWRSLTLKEAAGSADISQYALISAQQLVNSGKFKEEHFRQLTFNCKDTHLVEGQEYYSEYVRAHSLFNLFLQHEGDCTFTIYWACRAPQLMENILRHIHLAIVKNWAPDYVWPALLTARAVAKSSEAQPISKLKEISKIEDFLIDTWRRHNEASG